jgi:hypothetical protein
MNFAIWLTPGLHPLGFEDIAMASDEMSSLFANPFLDNATPWWGNASDCYNYLETGDAAEYLSNPIYAIPLNGRTYHPQNEALLP